MTPERTLRRLAWTLGVLLVLPSLGLGFFLDDLMYLTLLKGAALVEHDPWNLYGFVPQDLARTQGLVTRGLYPWWTLPELRLRFWRPLSSALLTLDHRLSGERAWLWHLHAIAWWLALLWAWDRLFRRTLPPRAAAWALLVSAVGAAHGIAVIWLSNRNAVVSAVPAFLGVLAHVRGRRDGWKPGRPLALLGLAAGFLGGETALAAFGVLAAWEAFAGPGGARERVRALVPAGALALAYAAAYRVLGFGSFGSGMYLDPVGDTGEFVAELPRRWLALAGALFGGLTSDLWFLAPGRRGFLVGFGLAALGAIVALRRALPAEERARTRWWLAAALLALVPFCAAYPSDRNLLYAAPGAAAVLGSLLTSPAVPRAGRWALGLVHLAAMPAFLLLLQLGFRGQRLAVERVAAEAELGSADEELVLVSAPDHQAGIYVPFQRVALGHPMPRSWRVLSLARHDHVLRRTGPDELELEVVGGRMMESMFEQVYRASRFPLPPGTAIDAGLFQVEVREGDGTGPTRVAFRFRRPLAEVRFLHWKDSRLRRLELPEVGASVRLPWSVGPLGL